jgi:hypothetical protein
MASVGGVVTFVSCSGRLGVEKAAELSQRKPVTHLCQLPGSAAFRRVGQTRLPARSANWVGMRTSRSRFAATPSPVSPESIDQPLPVVWIIMGVCGCGKRCVPFGYPRRSQRALSWLELRTPRSSGVRSTFGKLLAAELSAAFYEGDDYHSSANRGAELP